MNKKRLGLFSKDKGGNTPIEHNTPEKIVPENVDRQYPGTSDAFLKFIDNTIEQLAFHEGKPSKSKSDLGNIPHQSAIGDPLRLEKNVFRNSHLDLHDRRVLTTRGSCISHSPPQFRKEVTQPNTVKLSTVETNHKRIGSAYEPDFDFFRSRRESREITAESLIEENAKLKLQLLKKNQEFAILGRKLEHSREKSSKLKDKNSVLEKKLAKLVLLEGLSERNSIGKSAQVRESVDSASKIGSRSNDWRIDDRLFTRASGLQRSGELLGKQSFTLLIKNNSAVSSKGHSQQNSQIFLNFGPEAHSTSNRRGDTSADKATSKQTRVDNHRLTSVIKGVVRQSATMASTSKSKKASRQDQDHRIDWQLSKPASTATESSKKARSASDLFKGGGSQIKDSGTRLLYESGPQSPEKGEHLSKISKLNTKLRPSLNNLLKSR